MVCIKNIAEVVPGELGAKAWICNNLWIAGVICIGRRIIMAHGRVIYAF
jgi:hypothetical protein